MKIRRSGLATFAYWVSLAVVLFAGAWYVLYRQFDALVRISLIMAVIALSLAVLADPERVRRAMTGRQARYGSNAMVFTLAFIGILATVNYLVYINPIKWDLTEDQRFTLTPETIQLLDELSEEVKILGFYSINMAGARENARPLLDQYRLNSDEMLTYEYIDPDEDPYMAQQFNVIRDGSLVIVSGEVSEIVETASEEEITEALVRVLHPTEHKLYFLVGHGERDINATDEFGFSQLKRSLESKNYTVENLNLLSAGGVPEDASALIVAAPQAQLVQNEIDLINQYMYAGGALMLLMEPMPRDSEGADDKALVDYLLSSWGIDPLYNLVIDLNSQLPYYGISSYYGQHPITEEMENLATYFPTVRSFVLLEIPDTSIERTELVQTGENSWGETDFAAIENQEIVEHDAELEQEGPLPVVISAENSFLESRMVLFGDSDFASNVFFFELGNGDLFLNSVDWVVGEEKLINLSPKQSISRYVVPPTNQVVGVVFLVTIVLIPGIVVIAGVSTWWRRRKQA